MVGIAPQALIAATYDVLADFNATGVQPAPGNPNTYPFTYGTETTLNGAFALLPYFGNTTCSVAASVCTTNGSVNNYYFANPYQFSGPSIATVATGGTLTFPSSPVPLVVPNDVLVMMPGSPDYNAPNLVVTRFTAPRAGVFDITGSFTDLSMSSVSVAILINGATAFNSSLAGRSAYQGSIPFSINGVSLLPGMTVDFAVDSLGGQAFDVLGLTAELSAGPVSAVPLPPSIVVQATGLALLSFFAWRRKRKGADPICPGAAGHPSPPLLFAA
jgi:hypothetical protein